MTWFKRHPKVDEAASQEKAQAAIELSLDNLSWAHRLKEEMEAKTAIIARINQENNFEKRMILAYRGEA